MTGKRLIKLLVADGWVIVRRGPHGLWLRKDFTDGARLATVKDTRERIPEGTLGAILGPKQTGLGSRGLRDLDQRIK